MELKIHDQEIHLQRYWLEYGLKSHDLKSLAGSSIEVLSVGRLNRDAGPDFRDAVLKIDGRLFQGDVEVHLDSSGWYAHNHGTDPAYNRVILHVVSEQTTEELYIEREDGVRVHQVVLDYESTHAEGGSGLPGTGVAKEDCLLRRQPEAVVIEAVTRSAQQRFTQKIMQLREDLIWTSWEQLIFIRICEALGYSKNRKPFRKLAERLHFEKVRQIMQWVPDDIALTRCKALVFGTSGLLANRHMKAFLGQVKTDELADIWRHYQHTMQIKPMYANEWQFFRLRPHNFPTRRLYGLAILLHRFSSSGFIERFSRMLQNNRANKRLLSDLHSVIVVKDIGGVPGPDSGNTLPALIGKERAKDIVVNTVLPVMYLYFDMANQGSLRNKVKECYRVAPKLSDNQIVKKMYDQLDMQSMDDNLGRTAYGQQGLIHLQKNYCRSQQCDLCMQVMVSDS